MTSRRPDLPLAAPAMEGLTALDRDRAGSLADEGGASAAVAEARHHEPIADDRQRRVANGSWRAAALLAAGAFGVFAAWSVARRRGRS